MSPTVRRPLAVAVLLALAAAALPAQDTRTAAESAPASRVYRPPGRTYPMPGRDMGELPVADWASPAALKDFGVDLAKRLLPNDAGAVWIGVLTMLLVGLSLRPFRVGRALDALLLLSLAPFYVHLIDRQGTLDDAPSTRGAYVICFTAVYLLTAWWWLRGLVGSRAAPPAAPPSDEHGPRRPVKTIALGLVLLNAFLIAVRPPDDCGHYTNLGAQRMLERKSWPYGDEKLLGGAAATYGPVLYVVNAGVLALRPDATPNPPDALPDKAFGYVNPPMWAAKTVVALFHGAALLALFLIGRRLRDAATGWTLVALYAGSPYVLGLGGEATSVTGLGYVSHVAPAATILLAFAALPVPFLSGLLLNVAIGDYQVTPLGAHIIARTIGAKHLTPKNRAIWGLEEKAGPLDVGVSALQEYAFGLKEVPKGNIPPRVDDGVPSDKDPHDEVRKLDVVHDQTDKFLREGIIQSFCEGPCDPE